jgi:ribonucleotide monophosphatase NagD (HAD superfamily)
MYEVYILDLDGTLWNGSTPIPGTAASTYHLLKTKKVFFYTNGGYCSREYTYTTIINWLKNNLSPDQYGEIADLVTLDRCYNTAYLTARYLWETLPHQGCKVLTVGNKGLNDELIRAGFINAQLLDEESESMSEQEFADY